MMILNVLLAAPAANGQQGGGSMQFVFLLGMILVFWFFMIRPQSKKAKKQKEFINALEKGSKIVTHAGIHGRINKVNEDSTLELEISAGTFLKMEKSSISLELSEAANKADAPAAEKK